MEGLRFAVFCRVFEGKKCQAPEAASPGTRGGFLVFVLIRVIRGFRGSKRALDF